MIGRNIQLLWNTLGYLRWKQIKYQIWYRLKSKLNIHNKGHIKIGKIHSLVYKDYIAHPTSYVPRTSFTFLNQTVNFSTIEWNYAANGKLWVYNLNYFDFLFQKGISESEGIALIDDFIGHYKDITHGKEPYPTSLRIINLIKFCAKFSIHNLQIQQLLAQDVYRLSKNIEYHLLANHLLENAVALYIGGIYLDNSDIYTKGKTLLQKELGEQILADGAHYECTPMYHQLMLYRLLDCIQFSNETSIRLQLISYAQRMLSWSHQMSFNNGNFAALNDSATEITFNHHDILHYSKALGINYSLLPLQDSGYRVKEHARYKLIMDIGNIIPSYQPGHAHADTFNFVLHIDHTAIIVDTGISTYESNSIRHQQRSSAAHNTVLVGDQNSSQVWSSFRVGHRAQVSLQHDQPNKWVASHDGYKRLGILHKRSFSTSDQEILIEDILEGRSTDFRAVAHIHFHPTQRIELKDNMLIGAGYEINFSQAEDIRILDYDYALGYNRTTPSKKIIITFKERLLTKISVAF